MIVEHQRESLIESILESASLETRDDQRRIVQKTWLEHSKRARSVLIHSPTGSGKTIMGLLAARGLQDALGMRIGWVAMRRNLLAQAQKENQQRRFGVNLVPISMFD